MRLRAALILGLVLASTLPSAAQADAAEKAPVPACATHKAPLKIEEENKSWYSPNGQVALTLTDDNSLVLKGPDGKTVFSTKTQADSDQDGYAELTAQGELTTYYGNVIDGLLPVWKSQSGHEKYKDAALEICDDSTMRIVSGPNLLWSAP
ncbi:hypothetical protein GKQ77_13560 [Streptomyces sp. BG9H]|uniref:Bulb-type lectin domain-containing protein n=1 Tax=Streptomyces anatolicus TaxID=2675858 RepID=A0ABS6YNC7_9ACTN|nr:hypothetical protein [Streptomyces anatolicus]MBW5422580.1 hypothetical protein [Streptomyces anatolicus]